VAEAPQFLLSLSLTPIFLCPDNLNTPSVLNSLLSHCTLSIKTPLSKGKCQDDKEIKGILYVGYIMWYSWLNSFKDSHQNPVTNLSTTCGLQLLTYTRCEFL